MTDPLGVFYVHETTVERYRGESGYGVEIFDDPVVLGCLIDDTQRLVRNAAGAEVVSSTTVFYPAATEWIPPGSKVTLNPARNNRVATVLTVSVQDASPLPLPSHVEVSLT